MTLTLELVLLLLGIGVFAGVAAGFIGIGGGIIMVPVLLAFYQAQGIDPELAIVVAMGTSLAVGSLSSFSSSWRHHRQGNVLWKLVPALAIASFISGWVASRLANQVPADLLRAILAVALLAAALRMLLEKTGDRSAQPMRPLPVAGWVLIGLAVGAFAGFTGLAGGVLLVPAMAFFARVPTRHLAATSSSTVMFTAAAAAIGKLTATPPVALGAGFVGYVNIAVVASLAMTSIPAAQLGAWLNKRAGSMLYRRVFGLLLLIVVLRLVLTLL